MYPLSGRPYRLIYIVAVGVGLLWIIDSQALWLGPTQVLEQSSRIGSASSDRQETDRVEEMNRRIRVVAATTIAMIAGVEVLAFVSRRLRGYPKMIRRYFWDFKPPGLGSRICDLRTARVVGA